jgi:hypothetical protein
LPHFENETVLTTLEWSSFLIKVLAMRSSLGCFEGGWEREKWIKKIKKKKVYKKIKRKKNKNISKKNKKKKRNLIH